MLKTKAMATRIVINLLFMNKSSSIFLDAFFTFTTEIPGTQKKIVPGHNLFSLRSLRLCG